MNGKRKSINKNFLNTNFHIILQYFKEFIEYKTFLKAYGKLDTKVKIEIL